jgi:hypothetical protein
MEYEYGRGRKEKEDARRTAMITTPAASEIVSRDDAERLRAGDGVDRTRRRTSATGNEV